MIRPFWWLNSRACVIDIPSCNSDVHAVVNNDVVCEKWQLQHCNVLVCSWERRTDPRGRTYYVDHNTRTTTWQRPNVDMMNNIQQFQQMRQNRTIDNVARRSLYPTQAVASDDPLGPLPEGWGEVSCLQVCMHVSLFDTELEITMSQVQCVQRQWIWWRWQQKIH